MPVQGRISSSSVSTMVTSHASVASAPRRQLLEAPAVDARSPGVPDPTVDLDAAHWEPGGLLGPGSAMHVYPVGRVS